MPAQAGIQPNRQSLAQPLDSRLRGNDVFRRAGMIPYGRQHIDDEDLAAVVSALKGDYLTTGPLVDKFEKAFAAHVGAKHAIVCANGTAALHLAALALNLKEGESIIAPSMTFLATANAARYCNADVIFADVNEGTGLMEAHHLEEALKRAGDTKPVAVFPVHLTGECVDIAALREVADRHNLKIVTDAAHAVGSILHGKQVGACQYEDMCTFSFHPVKTMTMGEGGAITTNNDQYAATMRRMRTHGMVPKEMTPEIPHYYEMPEPGYNYRATDFQCALGLSQLGKLDKFVARRAELATLYDKLLAPLAPLVQVPQRHNYCQPGLHIYAVRIDFKKSGKSRAQIMTALKEQGIGTQVHYFPVHRQPYYAQRYGNRNLPGTEAWFERTLSLPFYYDLTDEQAGIVAETLKRALS
jgi:UDP-4-amino-4,6-dideoxy-N-acetyl-beta-L-altrosamine transaminase